MVKCICIDDSNKPNKIPQEKWVKEGETYTVMYTLTVLPQKRLAFELAEIDLDKSCFPYQYFLANRFAFTSDGLLELIDLIKESEDIDFSIKELMTQTNERTADSGT